MLACDKGHLEVLRLLIKAGCTLLSHPDNNGGTPALFAARCGHLHILKELFQQGADLNFPSGHLTPSIAAAVSGRVDILQWFEDTVHIPIGFAHMREVVKAERVTSDPNYLHSNEPGPCFLRRLNVTNKMHVATMNWIQMECGHCHKHGANQKCSKCASVYYCG